MTILELLRLGPVVPVIVIDREEQAVPLARALVAGGVRVLEVTLRTPVALEAVARIGSEVEGAIVGVGTITRIEDVADALAAGARFGVSPGLTAELAEAARSSKLPLLPGVMTPSEIIGADAAGFRELKLFPAQQAGGVAMLKALAPEFLREPARTGVSQSTAGREHEGAAPLQSEVHERRSNLRRMSSRSASVSASTGAKGARARGVAMAPRR